MIKLLHRPTEKKKGNREKGKKGKREKGKKGKREKEIEFENIYY
jgi:hypothetical protein